MPEKKSVPILIKFAIGTFDGQNDYALIMNYATSEERLQSELDTVAFAISPEIAVELGEALAERAQELIDNALSQTRQ